MILNRPSSDVPLGSRAGESATLDDDDVCGGGDAFVGVTAGVELLRPSNDLLLELLGVCAAFLQSLNKQNRRRSAASNNDALGDKLAACGADVVFD